jgi:hypothetical protein
MNNIRLICLIDQIVVFKLSVKLLNESKDHG